MICEWLHFIVVSGCEAPPIAASSMVLFMTVVDRWYSTTVVTKSSILDIAWVTDYSQVEI